MPESPLIVIVFRNDQSFDKFFHLPSRRKATKEDSLLGGIYERTTNTLHVFDWRGMFPHSGRFNAYTLAHELTHQLSFNTGLLNREGDVPACIGEGLGMYGEARDVIGPSDFGRCNWTRLSAITTGLRKLPWIPLRDLFSEDAILRRQE